MYYYYPCPKCGIPISEYEDDEEAEWDVQQKLTDATKDHFQKFHFPQDLIWTDNELKNMVKEGVQQSGEPVPD